VLKVTNRPPGPKLTKQKKNEDVSEVGSVGLQRYQRGEGVGWEDAVLCFHVGSSRLRGKTRRNANLISEISFTIKSSVLIARYITGD
jgi:hypothetical protein